jgi:dihydropteroate synthase
MSLPLVMGIINVTPDSFSGDGVLRGDDTVSRAMAQAEQMVADGADMLDVGGESSRPGSVSVSIEEEIRRVVPVITAIKKMLGSTPVSVDTVKADVAEKALQAGATIINDITALAGDARMGEVAARSGARVVLMHNRAAPDAVNRSAKTPGSCPAAAGIRDCPCRDLPYCQRSFASFDAPPYENVVADVAHVLEMRVDAALKVGVARDKIILDPGIGFGKTPQQNLALIANLGRIKALGFPVLMGLSRKSFIGHTLGLPVDERLEGTAAGVAISVMQGADIVRVHDVKFMARVVKMAAALRDAAE